MTVFVAMEASSEPRVLRTCGLPMKVLGCASLILSACSSPGPTTPPKVDCGLTTTDASCVPSGGAGGQSALDLPPVAKIRFNTLPPTGPNDYPYAPDALPTDAPQPRAGLYLSAADSFDPAGHAISFFWNVQDPTGKYLAVEPEPTAARVSVSTPGVGRYAISLAVVEEGGLRELTQAVLNITVAPHPCAPDGFSPPCSDELEVPGGTVLLGSADDVGFPNEHPAHLAHVASFVLDKYEVTVGRYRQFLARFVGDGFSDGVGAHPLIPGSGWQSAWNGQTSEGFIASISECGGPWTESPGANEARPISCVTWYQAFAFCIWEGKRFPTSAEWEYAAVGGDEQRTYPWGSAPASPTLAVYGCLFDGLDSCTDADLPVVGSLPAGAGRWGHLDLAGSVWEWTLDAYAPYSDAVCDNCANTDFPLDDGRVFRGGAYLYDDLGAQNDLRGASRLGFDGKFPDPTRGFRCARTP